MKILFLGYAVDFETAKTLSGVSIAGNKMQVYTLEELNKYEDISLSCITVYPVAAFPREKKIHFKQEQVGICEGLTGIRVSFLNLPIIKQIHQTLSVWHVAKKIADKDTIVLSFNLFPQVGLPLCWLKKKYGCKTCSLLADLPIDDNTVNKNPIRLFFRSIFDKLTRKALRNCDSLVVLNANAAKKYAPNTKFTVMEGGIDAESIIEQKTLPYAQRKKALIYSGALTEYSGILQLIEAMDHVTDASAILKIYGGGNLCDKIVDMVKDKPNIEYCGKVTYKEMLEIQRHAYLLINPRPVDDAISKVTFPSKIFEYMASGTAVLATEINGLTVDYLENIYHVSDNTAASLSAELNRILTLPNTELEGMAQNARDFIVNNKTWTIQIGKLYNFIKKI